MMISRRIGLAAVCLAATACLRAPMPPVPDVPAPAEQSRPLLPPAVDLTGSWYVGTGAEPEGSRITLHPGCARNPAEWVLRQQDNAVEAWTFDESFNQGIVRSGPGVARVTPARGTISGAELRLDDAGVIVAMRYDSVSTHLRGTRDRRPFWAVRQVIVREACPGIPETIQLSATAITYNPVP